jgi:glycosyltransferase involved in cell wall biosynthesis
MKRNEDERVLTIVVPVYNEGEILHSTASSIVEFSHRRNWNVIFVNDGSQDNTKTILEELSALPNVWTAHHKVNRGYGGALKTGIALVKTPYLITIDADGQHSLDDVEMVLQFGLEHDADMVVGKRNTKPALAHYRSLGKWLIRTFTRTLMPLPITDLNSGFKLYRTALAQRYISVCPNSMAFSDIITLIFINEHNLVLEYPIHLRPRRGGQSTITTYTALETVIEILNIAVMFNPLRVFLPASILCVLAGLGWGIPIILLGRGVSVGAMLAIVIGLLFFVIGLLASQLSAIRMERLRDHSSKLHD